MNRSAVLREMTCLRHKIQALDELTCYVLTDKHVKVQSACDSLREDYLCKYKFLRKKLNKKQK